MNVDDIQKKLESEGLILAHRKRTGNDKGFQLRFKSGEIVNVFDNGTITPQGKNADRVREMLQLQTQPIEAASLGSRRVFVVYGHDTASRTQLEAMLRRWDLEPVMLDQLPSEGQTLIEKLEKYTGSDVGFAVVLATPDDEAYPRGKQGEKRYRARQNVVLELGLLLRQLGRAKVAILLKNQNEMERPSDIQGLIYLPFSDDVAEAKVTLAKEMEKQGIKIQVAKL